MKVDEGFYKTKGAFFYDIEQIIHNAKQYNPLTGTSKIKTLFNLFPSFLL
jgi:hypothetical protein